MWKIAGTEEWGGGGYVQSRGVVGISVEKPLEGDGVVRDKGGGAASR